MNFTKPGACAALIIKRERAIADDATFRCVMNSSATKN